MIFGCRRTTTALLQSGLADTPTSPSNTKITASLASAHSKTSAGPRYPPGNRLLIFWQRNGSGKCHRTRAFTLVIFFYVQLEFGVHLVISLLGREFASSGKALAAIGTPPRDRVPIDLFSNNQLRHMFSISQSGFCGCAIVHRALNRDHVMHKV